MVEEQGAPLPGPCARGRELRCWDEVNNMCEVNPEGAEGSLSTELRTAGPPVLCMEVNVEILQFTSAPLFIS